MNEEGNERKIGRLQCMSAECLKRRIINLKVELAEYMRVVNAQLT
jgi:hypothetical protein